MLFEQAWQVSTAVLRRRPRIALPPSADGHFGAAGQQRLGDGARTATALAVHHRIRWAPPPQVDLAGQGAEPGPRAPTPAGKHRLPPHQFSNAMFRQKANPICFT